MATNKSMIKLLEDASKLIDRLTAFNKVLKRHIAQQKRQPSSHGDDKYTFDKRKNAYKRVDK